jgi:hypothetical protein
MVDIFYYQPSAYSVAHITARVMLTWCEWAGVAGRHETEMGVCIIAERPRKQSDEMEECTSVFQCVTFL